MTLQLIFWILMLLWLVFGLWGWFRPEPNWFYGHTVFLFILFLVLGWATFGAPIH